MYRALRPAVAFSLAFVPALACGSTDVQVLSTDDAGAGADAGLSDATYGDGGTRAEYCAGSGPPVLVTRDDAGTHVTCADRLAQTSFRFALCTCDGYVNAHGLTTDSFDGAKGAYDPGAAKAGGSVGTNGNFNSSGALSVGGTLWAGDATGMSLGAAAEAKGELRCAGHAGTAALKVGANAWVADDLVANGDLAIAGTLTIPAGKTLSATTQTIGKIVRAPVTVAPPCDCNAADFVDVASFVESYRSFNDDAAVPIDPRLFESPSAPVDVTIPCGRFFFTRVGANVPVKITVLGRAAIFVGGDLSATGDFVVDVPRGSELDLFVEGNVTVGGQFRVGDVQNPAKARTYVGGGGTVNLQNATNLAGNLYAPRAEVVLGDAATAFGSIFARRVSAGGDLTIHYDESVLRTSTPCAAPSSCRTCRDCANQACIGGTCGACTDDAQCCAPLVCRSGACVLDIR